MSSQQSPNLRENPLKWKTEIKMIKKKKKKNWNRQWKEQTLVEIIIEEKLNCIIRAGSSRKGSEKKASLEN